MSAYREACSCNCAEELANMKAQAAMPKGNPHNFKPFMSAQYAKCPACGDSGSARRSGLCTGAIWRWCFIKELHFHRKCSFYPGCGFSWLERPRFQTTKELQYDWDVSTP